VSVKDGSGRWGRWGSTVWVHVSGRGAVCICGGGEDSKRHDGMEERP